MGTFFIQVMFWQKMLFCIKKGRVNVDEIDYRKIFLIGGKPRESVARLERIRGQKTQQDNIKVQVTHKPQTENIKTWS